MLSSYHVGESVPWLPLDDRPPPDDLPLRWNVGYVALRLIGGYEVLCSMPGRVGPLGHGSTWPDIVREFADYLEEAVRVRKAEEVTEPRRRWLSEEISRSDEALHWPARFLRDVPCQADSVQVWALAKGGGYSLRGILRARLKRATRIAEIARISPSQAMPGKVLSDASLRRYLRAGLESEPGPEVASQAGV